MLLTYGNIRKSRILKYMYCEDIDDNLYFNRLEEYEKSIPYKQFLSIREFLHDTDIVIKKNKNDISIYAFSRNKTKCYNIIFKNAKILSLNCVKRNGHISRLNRNYRPLQYGYEEFYENNGKNYISIIIFGKKIKKGIYYPFITIEFENIEII